MKYSIKDLRRDFPNDKAILDVMFSARFGRECGCGGTYSYMSDRKYQCGRCRNKVSPTAGTIFHKSTTPLTDWLHVLFIFSQAKSGVSAKEIEMQIGCTYKTAWRMLKLIRGALPTENVLTGGVVEVDEAYLGGRQRRTGSNNEYNKLSNKSVVYGAVDRENKKIVAKVMPNATAKTTGRFLASHIKRGVNLYTDGSNRYKKVGRDYVRKSVDHSRGEYVRGEVHVNSVENFWGHIKRSVRKTTLGTHKHISKEHTQGYINGFSFHYNHRGDDAERFLALLNSVLSAVKAE